LNAGTPAGMIDAMSNGRIIIGTRVG